jgi:tape measure domain-containing protein
MAVNNIIFKLQADTSALRTEFDSLKKQIDDTEKKATGFGNTLRNAALAFGGVQLGSQLLQFGKDSLQAAADFQTLNIQFETFLGGTAQAKKAIADLEKFSIETPFTDKQVQSAAKSLLAFGLPAEDLKETLTVLGNISAGTGKDLTELSVIFGQIKSTGRLMGQDLYQLINAGFNPLQTISEKTGKSVAELKKEMEKGNISFAQVEQAFKDATSAGGLFDGLIEKLSKSVAGRISTLEGNFDKLKQTIGLSLLPAFEGTVEAGIQLVDFLQNLPTFIEQNKTAITLLTGALLVYVAAITRKRQVSLLDRAETIKDLIVDRAKAAQLRIQAIFTNTAAASTGRLTIAQRANAIATNIATAATQGFNAAWKANPIGLIITGLTLAYTAFQLFADSTNEAAKEIDVLEESTKIVGATLDSIQANVEAETTSINRLFDALQQTNKGEKQRLNLINEINSKYGTTLQNYSDEKQFIDQINKVRAELIKQKRAEITLEASKNALLELDRKDIDLKLQKTKANQSYINVLKLIDQQEKENLKGNQQRLQSSIGAVSGVTAEVAAKSARKTAGENLKETLKGIDDQIAANQLAAKEIEQIYLKAFESINAAQSDPAATDKFKKELLKLQSDLSQIKNDIRQKEIELISDESFENQKKKIIDLAKLDKEKFEESIKVRKEELKLEFKGSELDALNKVLDLILLKRKQLIDLNAQNQIDVINEKELEDFKKAVQGLKEVDFQTELENLQNANKKLVDEQQKLYDDLNNATTKKQRDSIRKQIEERNKEIAKGIKAEADLKIKEIERQRDEELKNNKLQPIERLLIEKKAALDILKIKNETADQVNQLDQKSSEEAKKISKAEIEARKKALEQLAKETVQLINQVIEARKAEAQAAIDAQTKRIEKAKEIAENGNAELLQLEEERLTKLNQQYARYVRQQQALTLIQLTAESALAIAKAARDGGAAAPFTIAATLIALAAGFVAAKAQASQAIGSFASGGYTGDGGKYESAGIVHKGEFVFNQETTRKHRSLFDQIHKGRDPFLSAGLGQQIVIVNNSGMDERLARIENAIIGQERVNLSIDESGIHGLVSRYQWKNNRIRNKAR